MAKLEFADLKAEYTALLKDMVIQTTTDKQAKTLATSVERIKANQDQYKKVMQRTGVPWPVVGIIHSLEADCDLKLHLHNGNPLTARTKDEPSGRPLTGTPPFDWVDSAVDALTMPNHFLHTVKNWPVERIAYELEKYNGFGYRLQNTGVNTPYDWSFTNHYTKGKFIADHVFNPNKKVSKQARWRC
jgi:lysozyme family protein